MKSRIIMAVITAAFLACICTMPMSAMVPSMFGWTGWAACPQGTTIDVSKRPLAERSGYRVVVTCYDQAGQAFEANQTLGLIALFGIVFLGMLVTSVILMVFMRRSSVSSPTIQAQKATSAPKKSTVQDKAEHHRMAKLAELKQLLDANLITPEDYEAKKQEVLSQI